MSTTVKELLEAGVHFGHQAHRWNPKMARYILGTRNGIHLVDLRKTAVCFDKALDAVSQVAGRGGRILFVGTKKQAQDVMAEEARRCGQYFVNRRWLGGQLTNFKTIKGRTAKLRELDSASADGTYSRYSKKEALGMERLREKLEKALGGIKEMPGAPDMLFVVDPRRERIAVAEANMLGIPVVAITDTNCDPDVIDYPVPGNDDAIRAIRLLAGRFADTILEARRSPAAQMAEKEQSEAASGEESAKGSDRPGRPAGKGKPTGGKGAGRGTGKPGSKPDRPSRKPAAGALAAVAAGDDAADEGVTGAEETVGED